MPQLLLLCVSSSTPTTSPATPYAHTSAVPCLPIPPNRPAAGPLKPAPPFIPSGHRIGACPAAHLISKAGRRPGVRGPGVLRDMLPGAPPRRALLDPHRPRVAFAVCHAPIGHRRCSAWPLAPLVYSRRTPTWMHAAGYSASRRPARPSCLPLPRPTALPPLGGRPACWPLVYWQGKVRGWAGVVWEARALGGRGGQLWAGGRAWPKAGLPARAFFRLTHMPGCGPRGPGRTLVRPTC